MQEYSSWLYSAITHHDNKIPHDAVKAKPEWCFPRAHYQLLLIFEKMTKKNCKLKLEEIRCNIYFLLFLCYWDICKFVKEDQPQRFMEEGARQKTTWNVKSPYLNARKES